MNKQIFTNNLYYEKFLEIANRSIGPQKRITEKERDERAFVVGQILEGEEVVEVTGSRLIDQIIAGDARRRKETNEQTHKQLGLIYKPSFGDHYGVC